MEEDDRGEAALLRSRRFVVSVGALLVMAAGTIVILGIVAFVIGADLLDSWRGD